jgi:hypothetical protein
MILSIDQPWTIALLSVGWLMVGVAVGMVLAKPRRDQRGRFAK